VTKQPTIPGDNPACGPGKRGQYHRQDFRDGKLTVGGISGNIYGIDAVIDLPAGVTVAADANGSVTSALTLIGGAANGSSTVAKYTDATDTTPGKIHLAFANTNGFGAGQFANIICDVAQGSTVPLSSFKNFTASVYEGNATDFMPGKLYSFQMQTI
jgi:hypothetical protein